MNERGHYGTSWIGQTKSQTPSSSPPDGRWEAVKVPGIIFLGALGLYGLTLLHRNKPAPAMTDAEIQKRIEGARRAGFHVEVKETKRRPWF